MATSSLLLLALLAAALTATAHGGATAVYWGQNANEGDLVVACNTQYYNYVNIAFLSSFGGGRKPVLNLAGHCNPSLPGDCAGFGQQVQICQSKGFKVLLSLGGAAGSYGLTSAADAKTLATYLWNNFLGGTSSARPFGPAVLDGIDLDIEQGSSSHYADLAKYLTQLGSKGERKLYLSASPQCPYPDAHLDPAVQSGLLDFVWVQFYNNPQCEYAGKSVANLLSSWNKWAAMLPAGKTKLFMGLPASSAAAGSGYMPSSVLIKQVLPAIKKSPRYGGVMLWNRYYDLQTFYGSDISGLV